MIDAKRIQNAASAVKKRKYLTNINDIKL